jgi:hypothetical protein
MSCGPACLRMLAEWTTREPQSEYHWRHISGWNARNGLKVDPMEAALKHVRNLQVARLDLDRVREWHESPEPPEFLEDSAILAHVDSYDYDGRNLGHWIIWLDRFPSLDLGTNGLPRHQLIFYADPLYDELAVWPWISLVTSQVTAAFFLTRLRNGA